MSDQQLLQDAADVYGYGDVQDMLEAATFDSVVPGICQCGYTTDVEPDGTGWCEVCDEPSCVSVLLIANII